MKFTTTITTTLLTCLLSSSALAAPAAATSESQMVSNAAQWTIENMKRTCSSNGESCAWSFAIDEHSGAAATKCGFTVKGKPAAETNSANNKCGGFTVSTGWSGQFGAGKGFTTLSVVDNAKKEIIYPSYTDAQLDTGKVVTPNQSYAPAALP